MSIVNFEISYTLDVLFYIECMLNCEKYRLYDDEVSRFMPMLGTVSDQQLAKLHNIYMSSPDSIHNIVAMLITNPELHTWKSTDLFDNHKNLAVSFKRSKVYKNATPALKKFVTGEFLRMMPLIKTIVHDLERLEFKKFWLEECLPNLKECISEYETELGRLNIIELINGWVVDKRLPTTDQWYLLTYSGNEYQPVLRSCSIISPMISANELFAQIVEYAVQVNDYRKFCKGFKPTVTLKAEHKAHPLSKSFKGITGYVEMCLKMALKKYLTELAGKTYTDLSEDYPFASVLYEYMKANERLKVQLVGDYVGKMMKSFGK